MARSGLLCPDAVAAVLAAAGHSVRAPDRPSVAIEEVKRLERETGC
jgi:hypothetical protein